MSCDNCGMYGCMKFNMPRNDFSCASEGEHICDSLDFLLIGLLPSLLNMVPQNVIWRFYLTLSAIEYKTAVTA